MAPASTLRDLVLSTLRQQRDAVLRDVERLGGDDPAAEPAIAAELVRLHRRLGEIGAAIHDVAVCSDAEDDPRLAASLRCLGAFDTVAALDRIVPAEYRAAA